MAKQNCRGQAAQVTTVATIEIPALGDPLEREELSLNEIRRRCGYAQLMQCTICSHSKRDEIEKAVMTKSARQVAREYGVGRSAIASHMRNHFVVPK